MEDRISMFQDMTTKSGDGTARINDTEDTIQQPTEVESLCINCGKMAL